MNIQRFEPVASDDLRRAQIYGGELHLYAPRESTRALCQLAREMSEAAFAPLDPRHAQFELPVERHVDSRCTGTAMGDYLRGSDLEKIPEEFVSRYMEGFGR